MQHSSNGALPKGLIQNLRPILPDAFHFCSPLISAAGTCLVFEDAPSGVEAGLSAGMRVVMVPDARLDKALRGRAHQEIDSLEDFDPRLWGLPPFG